MPGIKTYLHSNDPMCSVVKWNPADWDILIDASANWKAVMTDKTMNKPLVAQAEIFIPMEYN